MDDKHLMALIGRVDVETPGVPLAGLLRDEVKVGDYQARLLAIARAVQAAERERCAMLCEAARPIGGRAWSTEQAACFDALTHVAQHIRNA